jgi:hypothetical protein
LFFDILTGSAVAEAPALRCAKDDGSAREFHATIPPGRRVATKTVGKVGLAVGQMPEIAAKSLSDFICKNFEND